MNDTVNVPREPTLGMLEAADRVGSQMAGSDLSSGFMTAVVWTAMLAAAPKAEPVSDPYKLEGDDAYLLVKRNLYYRPNANGYTGIKDNAGRYTKADAERHADPMCGVSMVLADEAPEFAEACFDDLARAHLQKKLDKTRAELAALRAQPEAPKVEQKPVAMVVSAHGDPEAFGEREIAVLKSLKRIPYNTPLYAHSAMNCDELLEAAEAISQDYQSSATHHPEHVLIRLDHFKALTDAIANHKGPQS